jgi:hypothetical protein
LAGHESAGRRTQRSPAAAKLGTLASETLLAGHREPIESGAAALVRALAAG